MSIVSGLQLHLAGASIDCADVLRGLRITYGAAFDVSQVNNPATATVGIVWNPADELPTIGAQLQLVATFDNATTEPRFTGVVDDVDVSWDTGEPVASIVAVGTSSRLARVYVGDEPWPAELDGDRARRIMDLANAQYPFLKAVDPGRVRVRPRDVDRQPVAALLADLATSTFGVVGDRRDGAVVYRDGDLSAAVPFAQLDACGIARPGYRVQLGSAQLVNDVTIVYGQPSTPGDDSTRPALRVTAPDSVRDFGPYAIRVDTELAAADDASDLAGRILAAFGAPTGYVPNAVVDSRALEEHHAFLAGLELLGRLQLTGLPGPGPAGLDAVVDGWVETWQTSTSWRVDLTLTDVRTRGLGSRWVDVPCVRWVDVPPTLTWRQADTWTPCGPFSGRWVDQPSTLLWDDAGVVPWPDWN